MCKIKHSCIREKDVQSRWWFTSKVEIVSLFYSVLIVDSLFYVMCYILENAIHQQMQTFVLSEIAFAGKFLLLVDLSKFVTARFVDLEKISMIKTKWSIMFISHAKIYFWTPAVAGRSLWNRVCMPAWAFSWNWIISFSRFWQGVRNRYKVNCDRARYFRNFFLPPTIGKMDQKQSFLNLVKNLVFNFNWICSIMKLYIICYVLAQIPCLGNVPEIWTKVF